MFCEPFTQKPLKQCSLSVVFRGLWRARGDVEEEKQNLMKSTLLHLLLAPPSHRSLGLAGLGLTEE